LKVSLSPCSKSGERRINSTHASLRLSEEQRNRQWNEELIEAGEKVRVTEAAFRRQTSIHRSNPANIRGMTIYAMRENRISKVSGREKEMRLIFHEIEGRE
jgi:hypothetical protein